MVACGSTRATNKCGSSQPSPTSKNHVHLAYMYVGTWVPNLAQQLMLSTAFHGVTYKSFPQVALRTYSLKYLFFQVHGNWNLPLIQIFISFF